LLTSLLPEEQGDPGLHIADLDSKLTALELFLRRAVDTSRQRDIRLVLSTMAVNLWMPPRSSGLTHDAKASEAILLAEEGRTDAALASLVAANGTGAEAGFRAGTWLARAGRTAEAYRELQRAVDEDPGPDRRPSAVNALIRSLAREPDVLLRDTEAAVEARAPQGLPGWESFLDNCHLTPLGVDIEARELLTLLGAASNGCNPAGWQRKRSRPEELALNQFIDGVLGTWGGGNFSRALTYAVATHYAADAGRTVAAVERAMARIESETQPRSDILVSIAEAWRQVDRTDEARRINEMARRRDPGSINALNQAAILAWRSGSDTQARAFATETLRIDPADQLAPALLRRVGGNTGESSVPETPP
jgi:tetratricopeptide (TPR) repeat protein